MPDQSLMDAMEEAATRLLFMLVMLAIYGVGCVVEVYARPTLHYEHARDISYLRKWCAAFSWARVNGAPHWALARSFVPRCAGRGARLPLRMGAAVLACAGDSTARSLRHRQSLQGVQQSRAS